MGWILNLVGGRLLMYGAFALAVTVGIAGWSGKMYYKGYKSGKQSVLEELEKIDARNIKKAQAARDSSERDGSFERLRKRYRRDQ